MIISIHISKTAGTSFKNLLEVQFGQRLFSDYGDMVGWNSPEAIARRRDSSRRARRQRRKIQKNYDAIHGHFIADKYLGLFPEMKFVTFVRDPYQQTMSNFHYIARNPGIDHPAVKAFHQNQMNVEEYVRFFPNPQAEFVGSLPIADFAVVGLTEDFIRSVKLFNATFGTALSAENHANTNPDRAGSQYEISPEIRRHIATYCAADIELYEHAKEAFRRQVAARSV